MAMRAREDERELEILRETADALDTANAMIRRLLAELHAERMARLYAERALDAARAMLSGTRGGGRI
jgi:hypothetical protein